MKKKNKERKSLIPSLPFIQTPMGDRKHRKHNTELAALYAALRKSGIEIINTRHIHPFSTHPGLPIRIGSKEYDISYVGGSGEIVLIELKILNKQERKRYESRK